MRRADEVAPLDPVLFAEAAEAVLFRPEKKLVRAGLTWLDRTAREPARVDAVLTALTVAFGQESLDLRERAAKIAARRLGGAGERTRADVRAAAATLPADLRALLGAEEEAAADVPVAGPPPYLPSPPPAPPIASLAELAEEVVVPLKTWSGPWPDHERLLAGLAASAHREPEQTAAALERVLRAEAPWVLAEGRRDFDDHRRSWLWAVLRSAVAPRRRPVPGRPPRVLQFPESRRHPAPHRILLHRMREITGLIGTAPLLLATPTAANGQIDPGEFAARLETLEAAGARPGPLDLEQALLRLPREPDAGALRRVRSLSSPAASAAADRMASGGPPDPTVTCAVRSLPMNAYDAYRTHPRPRGLDALLVATVSGGAAAGDVSEIAAPLHRYPAEGKWLRAPSAVSCDSADWWPAILPSQPEVIAAHLLAPLSRWSDERMGQGGILLALAEGDGPAGPATAAVLCHGLGAKDPGERSGAVDALLVLAARERLPAADLGRALGALSSLGEIKLNRVTAALRDAVRAGAHAGVWTALAAALPDLLPPPGRPAPTGLPDLIALAAEAAAPAGARAEMPELAAVAARGGSTRLVRESARLHRLLTTR